MPSSAWFGRRARAGAGAPRVDQGWPPPRGLARVLLVAPVVALTLLVVAALAALVPDTDQAPRRSVSTPRLATPTAAPGEVGGLLPDVLLGAPGGQLPSRDLRPAVLMLVPDGCACPQLVHQVIGQVEEYPGLDSAVIGSGDPAVAALASDRAGGDNRLPALTDAQSVLARTYHGGPAGSVPTLLFVAADGRLTAPPLVFTPGTRIESSLLPLVPLRA